LKELEELLKKLMELTGKEQGITIEVEANCFQKILKVFEDKAKGKIDFLADNFVYCSRFGKIIFIKVYKGKNMLEVIRKYGKPIKVNLPEPI
jgi:hypothetical protein